MRISFCTILLNEEKGLLRMLKSVEPFVDEYILLDNDSTDKTVKIIRDWQKKTKKCLTLIHNKDKD